MIFDADNSEGKLLKDAGNSFVNSRDGLIVRAMLRESLGLSLEVLNLSFCVHPPLLLASSFEAPFDDPQLEPLPLGPHAYSCDDNAPSQYSFVNSEGSSHKEPKPIRQTRRHQQQKNLILSSNFESIFDITKNKTERRSPELRSQQHGGPPPRQKKLRWGMANVKGKDFQQTISSGQNKRHYKKRSWRVQFEKLVNFKLEHGHCCVPHSYLEDPVLANWVKRQRYQFKKLAANDSSTSMTSQRVNDLESIGFVWDPHALAWSAKFNELKAFKDRIGHCYVPSHYPMNSSLSTWVKCQRRQYKLLKAGAVSYLTEDRLKALKSLNFGF